MSADIDIDFANRNDILKHIRYVSARKEVKGTPEKHNSGIYVQPIPYDPLLDCSALHHKEADERGYFKLDFLNMSVYQHIRDNEHYKEMLERDPPWHRLSEPEFVRQIVHIANYPKQVAECMPDSIPRMAMFLSAIRPAKRHLLGKPWKEMAETIWDKTDDEYSFKQAHAISYAVLVALHMNLVDTMTCHPFDEQV